MKKLTLWMLICMLVVSFSFAAPASAFAVVDLDDEESGDDEYEDDYDDDDDDYDDDDYDDDDEELTLVDEYEETMYADAEETESAMAESISTLADSISDGADYLARADEVEALYDEMKTSNEALIGRMHQQVLEALKVITAMDEGDERSDLISQLKEDLEEEIPDMLYDFNDCTLSKLEDLFYPYAYEYDLFETMGEWNLYYSVNVRRSSGLDVLFELERDLFAQDAGFYVTKVQYALWDEEYGEEGVVDAALAEYEAFIAQLNGEEESSVFAAVQAEIDAAMNSLLTQLSELEAKTASYEAFLENLDEYHAFQDTILSETSDLCSRIMTIALELDASILNSEMDEDAMKNELETVKYIAGKRAALQISDLIGRFLLEGMDDYFIDGVIYGVTDLEGEAYEAFSEVRDAEYTRSYEIYDGSYQIFYDYEDQEEILTEISEALAYENLETAQALVEEYLSQASDEN